MTDDTTPQPIKPVYHGGVTITRRVLFPSADERPPTRRFTLEKRGIEPVEIVVPQTGELEAVLKEPYHLMYYQRNGDARTTELVAIAGVDAPPGENNTNWEKITRARIYYFDPRPVYEVRFTNALNKSP